MKCKQVKSVNVEMTEREVEAAIAFWFNTEPSMKGTFDDEVTAAHVTVCHSDAGYEVYVSQSNAIQS